MQQGFALPWPAYSHRPSIPADWILLQAQQSADAVAKAINGQYKALANPGESSGQSS